MYVLLYWASIIVCCVKRFLLMSDRKPSSIILLPFNITGNWFHSAVKDYLLHIVKWVYTLVTVQIPHGVVTLSLGIQNFNLWFWLLSYRMNVVFQRLITQNKLCLKTRRMQNTTHASFCMCDCDFYLYYTLVLYSLIMICIFTLYFLSKLIAMRWVEKKTQKYFISS